MKSSVTSFQVPSSPQPAGNSNKVALSDQQRRDVKLKKHKSDHQKKESVTSSKAKCCNGCGPCSAVESLDSFTSNKPQRHRKPKILSNLPVQRVPEIKPQVPIQNGPFEKPHATPRSPTKPDVSAQLPRRVPLSNRFPQPQIKTSAPLLPMQKPVPSNVFKPQNVPGNIIVPQRQPPPILQQPKQVSELKPIQTPKIIRVPPPPPQPIPPQTLPTNLKPVPVVQKVEPRPIEPQQLPTLIKPQQKEVVEVVVSREQSVNSLKPNDNTLAPVRRVTCESGQSYDSKPGLPIFHKTSSLRLSEKSISLSRLSQNVLEEAPIIPSIPESPNVCTLVETPEPGTESVVIEEELPEEILGDDVSCSENLEEVCTSEKIEVDEILELCPEETLTEKADTTQTPVYSLEKPVVSPQAPIYEKESLESETPKPSLAESAEIHEPIIQTPVYSFERPVVSPQAPLYSEEPIEKEKEVFPDVLELEAAQTPLEEILQDEMPPPLAVVTPIVENEVLLLTEEIAAPNDTEEPLVESSPTETLSLCQGPNYSLQRPVAAPQAPFYSEERPNAKRVFPAGTSDFVQVPAYSLERPVVPPQSPVYSEEALGEIDDSIQVPATATDDLGLPQEPSVDKDGQNSLEEPSFPGEQKPDFSEAKTQPPVPRTCTDGETSLAADDERVPSWEMQHIHDIKEPAGKILQELEVLGAPQDFNDMAVVPIEPCAVFPPKNWDEEDQEAEGTQASAESIFEKQREVSFASTNVPPDIGSARSRGVPTPRDDDFTPRNPERFPEIMESTEVAEKQETPHAKPEIERIQEIITTVVKDIIEERVVEIPDIELKEVDVIKTIEVPSLQECVVVKEKPIDHYIDKFVPEIRTTKVDMDILRKIPIPLEQRTTVEMKLPKIVPIYEKVKIPVYLPRFIEIPIAGDAVDEQFRSGCDAICDEIAHLAAAAQLQSVSLCKLESVGVEAKSWEANVTKGLEDGEKTQEMRLMNLWKNGPIRVRQDASITSLSTEELSEAAGSDESPKNAEPLGTLSESSFSDQENIEEANVDEIYEELFEPERPTSNKKLRKEKGTKRLTPSASREEEADIAEAVIANDARSPLQA